MPLYNTNTAKHAERELQINVKNVPDSVLRNFVPEILALCERFGSNGESGGSAPMSARILATSIEKLLLQQPIGVIYGTEDEWVSVAEAMGGRQEIYQNNRDGRILREGKEGPAYFIDAIIYCDQNGGQFHSGGSGTVRWRNKKIGSAMYIKRFPFTPKVFYVNVASVEIEKDNWESTLVDEHQPDFQLALQYYDIKQKDDVQSEGRSGD
jgi:hypothetical protein